jgi:hypothetical protein
VLDPILAFLLLAALVDVTALYAMLVNRRVHRRRVDARIQAAAHLYGLVRVMVADRQAA